MQKKSYFLIYLKKYFYLCEVIQFELGGKTNEKETIYISAKHLIPANAGG